jgi:hypothetical protein
MDVRFRGHDRALERHRHPREMSALAEAGAGGRALQAQPLGFEESGVLTLQLLTEALIYGILLLV